MSSSFKLLTSDFRLLKLVPMVVISVFSSLTLVSRSLAFISSKFCFRLLKLVLLFETFVCSPVTSFFKLEIDLSISLIFSVPADSPLICFLNSSVSRHVVSVKYGSVAVHQGHRGDEEIEANGQNLDVLRGEERRAHLEGKKRVSSIENGSCSFRATFGN